MSDPSLAVKPVGRRILSRAIGIYPVIVVAILWQVAASRGWVNPSFLPSLDVIFVRLGKLIASGELFVALNTSLMRALVGVGVAALVGTIIGFMMAESAVVRWLSTSFVLVGFPMPKIALIPVFTLWLGIDSSAKIALVIVTCIFPFIIAAQTAAAGVSRNLVWAARSLGTSDYDMLRQVIFPATIPSLFNALRVAFPIGLITVFTAEMVTGGGVGEQIMQAQNYFDTPTVFAYIIVTMIVGYLSDVLIAWLQRRYAGWNES